MKGGYVHVTYPLFFVFVLPEEWFDIFQNMTNFVSHPKNVNKRFDSLLEACRQNRLDMQEQEQYFSAMLSEDEIQSIAAAYKEDGFLEGVEKGVEKGVKKGKLETAKNLKGLGVKIETISKATGLSLDELNRL